MRFTKMEGLGNDYLYINGFEEPVENPAALSVAMSRYHFGCGADGLILILPSQQADFRMRMFNSDGSESEMCGNGIRCVAKYCYDRGMTDRTAFSIESGGELKQVRVNLKDGLVDTVQVDMGAPTLDGLRIPSTIDQNPVIAHPFTVEGRTYPLTLVSVGNPHGVTFVQDLSTAPVTRDGPLLENHPDFPAKANIEFVHVRDRQHATMRVWERGTGETLACGTGACAVLVAGVLNGLLDREAEISLLGGTLQIHWQEADNHVYMTGPARFVYEGTWLG